MESISGVGEESERLGADVGSGEEEREDDSSELQSEYEVQGAPGFTVGVQHNDVDEWLDDLEAFLKLSDESPLVRLSVLKEPCEDKKVEWVFVMGGFFDEYGLLCELCYRCEEVDRDGLLFEGSEEAARVKQAIKDKCESWKIKVRGGRFTVK
jgi:hypothetical protein